MKRRFTILLAALLLSCGLGWAQTRTEVTDVLNRAFTGVTGTTYTEWSGKTSNSDAVYAGLSAGGNDAIQLRVKNNNEGIVTTASGGMVTKVAVVWNNNTSANRKISVWGKNTAYTSAADLFNTSDQGTYLGTLTYGTDQSTELTISDEYTFLGIRSVSGALYLDEIDITWEDGAATTDPTITVSPMTINAPAGGLDGNFTVTCANVDDPYVLDVTYFTSDGTALNPDASPDWISYSNLDTENATSIGYYIDANTGAARTAYLKIQCMVNGAPIVESGVITINQATILSNIAALTALTDAGNYEVTLTDAVVTYVNGNYAYIQDASGAVLYYKNGHGLTAGGVLNGTATVAYQVRNSNPQITDLTGVTPVSGTAPNPTEVAASAWNYTFGNVLSQYFKVTGATITQSSNKYYVSLGGEDIQLYKASGSISDLDLNKTYSITGFPTMYNTTKELQIFDNPEVEVTTEPSITVTPMTVEAPAAGLDGNFTVTCANVGDSYEFDVLYCTSDGTAVQGSDPDWIGFVNLNTENVTSVGYIIAANEGEARTAYLKIQCLVNGAPIVESELITINQAQYVVDYATLPFEWEGGASADFLDLNGVTAQGLGSDYASGNAPYLIKFDGTGDYIQVKCDQQPGKVTIGVKMIGGSSTSTITIQGSADGETFTNIQELTISGAQNDELTLETTTGFAAEDRYVRMLFTKGSNVGVGPISIAVPSTEPSITVNPDVFDLDAAQHLTLQMPLTYENLEVENYESFAVQFYDTNNEPTTKPDWIFSASVTGTNYEGYNVTLTMISANEGEARSAYLKVFALDETDNTVYSNLVTINQEGVEVPPTGDEYALYTGELVEGDYLIVYGGGAMNTTVTNDRLQYEDVTVTNGVIVTDNAAIVWHIARSGEYWTIYNADADAYAASTGVKNKAQMLADGTNDKAMWTVSGTETYEFVNKANSEDNVNANLRRNGTYGFACYATSTGGALSLYKKVETLPANSIVIEGYGESEGGYYLIASPFTVSPEDVQGMTEGEYDLYSFDEAEENEWRNYKADAFENLEPGKGYLYAHSTTVTLTFDGVAYNGDPIVLKKTAGGDFPGWNLVGNPYTETAYIARDFYVMNPETGGEIITGEGNEIAAMQGFFVIAANDGEELEISTTAPAEQGGKIVMNVSNGRSSVIDRAMVRFGEGRTLPKFMLNDENTKIYITEGNEEFAVVRSIDENATPVSFHAAENGTYTLSINAENVEMEYLHLLDNMTGADVDLLATPSYTFEARTTDYANRFKLVYATTTDVNENNVEPFAFFNGSEWVINNEGEATLQVIDINGRMLSNETVNGNANVNINATSGIYMLRLVNGESVKTQKVVVK